MNLPMLQGFCLSWLS